MENKLWTFGDSFTAGILPDIDHFPPYVKYLEYLGIAKEEFPEGWGFQLSSKLGMDYETHSSGGASNEEIFVNICKNSNRFKKGDIVIVGWTYLNRFLWGLEKKDYDFTGYSSTPFGKFSRASAASSHDPRLLSYASPYFYETLALNKSLECWVDVVLGFETMIDTLAAAIGFDVYYWSADHLIHTTYIDEFKKKKYILNDIVLNKIKEQIDERGEFDKNPELFFTSLEDYDVTSIFYETGGLIDDRFHRGINGNAKQAELFYSWIKNERYPDKVKI